jgi:hypothetical protein
MITVLGCVLVIGVSVIKIKSLLADINRNKWY